eukprot:7287189-Pyramimonas_sp.AAC.1
MSALACSCGATVWILRDDVWILRATLRRDGVERSEEGAERVELVGRDLLQVHAHNAQVLIHLLVINININVNVNININININIDGSYPPSHHQHQH